MRFGWTPTEIAALTLGQLLAALHDDGDAEIPYADGLAHVQRARALRAAGLGGLL